jgi:hypothetical protein
MAAGGESPAHRALKRLALFWVQTEGYRACAFEVMPPRCRFRADLAAYKPARATRSADQPAVGLTAIFECKQARSDFLIDSRSTVATRRKLVALQSRRETLERLLCLHYPSLRSGDSLFPDFDAPDLSRLEHRNYRHVLAQISRLQRRLYRHVKFETITRYACANLFYLVVEPAIVTLPEVPVGWGLLVRRDETLELHQRPTLHPCAPADRFTLLQRIAAAGTRALNVGNAIPAGSIWDAATGRLQQQR